MYTEEMNIKHANKIKDYMAANPGATRTSISKGCILSKERVMFLGTRGYVTIPEPTPLGLRNGRKRTTENNE